MSDEPNQKEPRNQRGQNPNSQKNLRLFSSTQQPAKTGRPKGTPDRATVLLALQGKLITVPDPADPKNSKITVSLYEAAALGQFRAAMNGNTNAWKEIQDSLHGKMIERRDIRSIDVTHLSDEELQRIIEED